MSNQNQYRSPFALLEKKAFGSWAQNKIDGAWNGIRDNVAKPMQQMAQGVATNAGNALHDAKQVAGGIGDAAVGTAKNVGNLVTAPNQVAMGAIRGGMNGGNLGQVIGGAVDGGWNAGAGALKNMQAGQAQAAGGLNNIVQGTVNGVSNAVKTVGGAQGLVGMGMMAPNMAAYHGIKGAIDAPGATPQPGAPAAAPAAAPAPAPAAPAGPAPSAVDAAMQKFNQTPVVTPQAPAAAPAAPAGGQGGPTPEQMAQFRKGTASDFNPQSWLDRNKMNGLMTGQKNWGDNGAARSAGRNQQYAWQQGAQKSAFALLNR